MPFGLSAASQTFMRVVESLYSDTLDTCIYLDDILIFSENHKKYPAPIFEKIIKNGSKVNLKKL